VDPVKARVVRIRNTQELEHIWVSESLAKEIQSSPELSERVKLLGEPRDMQFDVMGTLAR
jgi:hypothetical protein